MVWTSVRPSVSMLRSFLPDNQAHAGDTTVIRLPNEFTLGIPQLLSLRMKHGALVANGVLDSDAKDHHTDVHRLCRAEVWCQRRVFSSIRGLTTRLSPGERDIPATLL